MKWVHLREASWYNSINLFMTCLFISHSVSPCLFPRGKFPKKLVPSFITTDVECSRKKDNIRLTVSKLRGWCSQFFRKNKNNSQVQMGDPWIPGPDPIKLFWSNLRWQIITLEILINQWSSDKSRDNSISQKSSIEWITLKLLFIGSGQVITKLVTNLLRKQTWHLVIGGPWVQSSYWLVLLMVLTWVVNLSSAQNWCLILGWSVGRL
jgi:hypothetical protein